MVRKHDTNNCGLVIINSYLYQFNPRPWFEPLAAWLVLSVMKPVYLPRLCSCNR